MNKRSWYSDQNNSWTIICREHHGICLFCVYLHECISCPTL